MAFPGIDSILDRPASVTWPDETARPDIAALLDMANRKIATEHFDPAATALDLAQRLDPTGSYDMRLRFLCGLLFAGRGDNSQAISFLTQAQDIAKDANDFDSFIVVTLKIAEVLHDALQYHSALEYYQIAHSEFERKYGEHPEQNVPLDILLLTFRGRQLWTIGLLEEAHGKLAAAMTLWHEMPPRARSQELKPFVAITLWMLGLTLRAQSDMRDGDAGYIKKALSHMRTAAALKRDCGDEDYRIGRLYIQIAELYLDLAELNAQRGSLSAAKGDRTEAKNYAQAALDFIAPTVDHTGALMARFTLLRCEITARSRQSLMRGFEHISAALLQLERESAPMNDRGLIAKIATLRAEWQILLGELVTARASLEFAFKGFEENAAGQSTRAERLLRMIDDPAAS